MATDFFCEHAERLFPHEVASTRFVYGVTDMRSPHDWYPEARRMRRKIIFHAGPTNSGKSYSAMKALASARSGESNDGWPSWLLL